MTTADLLDALILIIPSLDWASDALQLITVVLHGGLLDDMLYFSGFACFFVSQLIRLATEWLSLLSEAAYNKHIAREDSFCACLVPIFVMVQVPIWVIFGAFALLERVIKFVLLVLDPILGLSWCKETGEFAWVVRDLFFCLTSEEREFFLAQPALLKYYFLWFSFFAGGRWHVLIVWPWKLEQLQRRLDEACGSEPESHQPGTIASMREKLESNMARSRLLTKAALVEEVLENIGGIIMAVATLRSEDVTAFLYISSLVSLGLSGLSGIFETGLFVAKLLNVKEE